MTQILDASEFIDRYDLDIDALKPIASLLKVSASGPWLVGGSVRRLITKAPQDSDFDVAFVSQSQLDATCESLLAAGFKQSRDTDFHKELVRVEDGRNTIIQLLKVMFSGEPSGIISEFDYTICMCAFDGSHLHLGDYTLWDLGRKRLAINKVTFAASTVRRLIKCTKQGYTACSGCIEAILKSVAENPSLIRSDVEYVD